MATEVVVESSVLESPRSLYVRLPENYAPKTATYPVLYLMHGQWDMLSAASTIDLLGVSIPNFVIVGVESKGMELRPDNDARTPLSRFLTDEVVPYVNSNYAAAPYRILSGHSNAGRFVLNEWLGNSGAFSAYYAFSPSLEDNFIVDKVRAVPLADLGKMPPLVVTIADEGEHMQNPFNELVSILQKSDMREFQFKRYPEETHQTSKHPSLQFALQTSFSDWEPSAETKKGGLDSLRLHHQTLSKKYGFDVEIPADTLQRMTAYYATRETDDAKHDLSKVIKFSLQERGLAPGELFEISDYLTRNGFEQAGQQVVREICSIDDSAEQCRH